MFCAASIAEADCCCWWAGAEGAGGVIVPGVPDTVSCRIVLIEGEGGEVSDVIEVVG
jgi:hypothetical protein